MSQSQISHLIAIVKKYTSFFLILEIVLDSSAKMNRNAQFISRILKHNRVQLPSMSIEHRSFMIRRWSRLVDDEFTIPLVDVEAVVLQVNRMRTQPVRYTVSGFVMPSSENAAGVGTERDDIAESFEFFERFVDGDFVTLSVAFDCCC